MSEPRRLMELAEQMAGVTWTARQLEVGEGTVRRWADLGKLPGMVKMPDGTRLFHKATIERLVATRAEERATGNGR